MPPIAGHHIQCNFTRPQKCSKPSSKLYMSRLSPAEARPTRIPSGAATSRALLMEKDELSCTGNRGPAPSQTMRNAPAMMLAAATGTRERGLHSNSSSSTASRIAASGAAKVADMPAAAPATRSVVLSASVSLSHCATSEPKAPPVIMIGPSAPKGPRIRLRWRRRSASVSPPWDRPAHRAEGLLQLPREFRVRESSRTRSAP